MPDWARRRHHSPGPPRRRNPRFRSPYAAAPFNREMCSGGRPATTRARVGMHAPIRAQQGVDPTEHRTPPAVLRSPSADGADRRHRRPTPAVPRGAHHYLCDQRRLRVILGLLGSRSDAESGLLARVSEGETGPARRKARGPRRSRPERRRCLRDRARDGTVSGRTRRGRSTGHRGVRRAQQPTGEAVAVRGIEVVLWSQDSGGGRRGASMPHRDESAALDPA